MENLDPPLPPKSRMGKWRVFALCAPSSLIWGGWGFAVPFYFVQDCLKASTGVTHSVMIAIMTRNLRLNASKLNAFKANLVICQWTHTKQKNSLIISLYEVRYALLTTREFCCVEDKKKTNLCLIHCNNFNKLEGRTPQNIYRNCIGWQLQE